MNKPVSTFGSSGPAAGEFCSTREAAQLLGIAVRTVQLWVESGTLRAWKTAGGHRRIARASIDVLLRERAAVLAGSEGAAGGATTAGRGKASEPPRLAVRLLVVEDEPSLLALYRLQIAGWKFPVALETADNGFDGLVRIGRWRPDILVIDLNMPGMDGFRMVREIRANPDLAAMEIVVVTALDRTEIEDRGGLPHGVPRYAKPIPFSQLERRVAECARALGLPSDAR